TINYLPKSPTTEVNRYRSTEVRSKAMSRRSSYHLTHRFSVSGENVEMIRDKCSPSEKYVWITSSERLKVHTIKGVPGKYVDVLLPQYPHISNLVCEVGRKIGSYDGNER